MIELGHPTASLGEVAEHISLNDKPKLDPSEQARRLGAESAMLAAQMYRGGSRATAAYSAKLIYEILRAAANAHVPVVLIEQELANLIGKPDA